MMTTPSTEIDPRWPRLIARDRAADGQFWFSVASTGIYCRPSCPARRPKPEHVQFHASPAAARAAGFRPCRRCDPDGASADAGNAALIEIACRTIEAAETPPDRAALAAAAGLSPGHFASLFKRLTGLTPRAYAAACKADRLRGALAAGQSVTAAQNLAGYGSSSRLHAVAAGALGMEPRRYARGGVGEILQMAAADCSLGRVVVAFGPRGIAAILLGDEDTALRADLARRFPAAQLVEAQQTPVLAEIVALVDDPRRGADLPLDLRGSLFQARVWQALRQIPPGQTMTYGALAAQLGRPTAARAVAAACAANPLAVAVPCHRVVAADGALTGYRWGIERKRTLLNRERGE